jgi:hypothetical protein
MRRFPVVLFLVAVCVLKSYGQTTGIHGLITDEVGNPLSFATIFVKQIGTGTTANADGLYEIALAEGRY